MKIHEVKSFAKINLALHVTGKLTNLHKIESVVNFIELHDKIFIKKINSNKHNISSPLGIHFANGTSSHLEAKLQGYHINLSDIQCIKEEALDQSRCSCGRCQ